MDMKLFIIHFINILNLVHCGYSPTGDDVQVGSVLLPASRRGRYLANIVRRQAVDGTGIKFNKDADRMNAEAKKKVDVLSEELLPYIIAEQERRTTLYKRIMTAIQNGEKGVTVAEIRNKPPLIIRKGLMYRCPANRAPKEPDGSGVIMCEEDIEPTPVMYDSCLSAEDKELYVAENKFFFCNRHKVEGPDLPRNGTTVVGCAPIERTSLNYTTSKCALEDTDDVVVHYRYYPDRTYKFVTELDPDREVCDHWNPCQIGYIYSLPSPDRATTANELWHDYAERFDEYERDEIVPPVPEDNLNEFVPPNLQSYSISRRKVLIPEGYVYNGIGRSRPMDPSKSAPLSKHMHVDTSLQGRWLSVGLEFKPFQGADIGRYFVRVEGEGKKNDFKFIPLVNLHTASSSLYPKTVQALPGQRVNTTAILLKCNRCQLKSVMLRGSDGGIQNLDGSKYRMKSFTDAQGKQQKYIEIDLEGTRPQDFGDYFAVIGNEDGTEERIKALALLSPVRDTENLIKATRLRTHTKVGEHYDKTMTYQCDSCEMVDIFCNGDSVLSNGRVTVVPGSKLISFNFPSFEDSNSCVYIGIVRQGDKTYKKILAILENDSPAVTIPNAPVVNAPNETEQFEQEIPYTCSEDCSLEKVMVNGVPLEVSTRRNMGGTFAFYTAGDSSVIVRITEYTYTYEGVYQAVFGTSSGPVTKTIMEIRDASGPEVKEHDGASTECNGSASGAGPGTDPPSTEAGPSDGTSPPETTPAAEGGASEASEAPATEGEAGEAAETPAPEG